MVVYEKWEQEVIKIENDSKNIEIFVDIIDNRLYVMQNGKIIKEYLCAPGKFSTPSPIGNWKVISKDTWGEGFGGRWIGLNVPWGRYGFALESAVYKFQKVKKLKSPGYYFPDFNFRTYSGSRNLSFSDCKSIANF